MLPQWYLLSLRFEQIEKQEKDVQMGGQLTIQDIKGKTEGSLYGTTCSTRKTQEAGYE